jgi:hypothetical protein
MFIQSLRRKSISIGQVALDRIADDKCLDYGPLVSTQPDLSVAPTRTSHTSQAAVISSCDFQMSGNVYQALARNRDRFDAVLDF